MTSKLLGLLFVCLALCACSTVQEDYVNGMDRLLFEDHDGEREAYTARHDRLVKEAFARGEIDELTKTIQLRSTELILELQQNARKNLED